MRPTPLALELGVLIEQHDGVLALLEVTLQVVVQALHDTHPELADDEPAPLHSHGCLDRQLAAAVVTAAVSLLDLLRCYRAARDADSPF